MKSIFERYAENINYYAAPGLPGNKIAIFENGNVYTDVEPKCCNQRTVQEYINQEIIPWAFVSGIFLKGVDHGSFFRNREYCPVAEIAEREEEDYSVNADILNYVFAVMVASEEHAKGKLGITVVEYIGEADMCTVQEFKDKIEFEEYVKDYLKDIEEEFKMTNLKYSEAIRRVEKRGYKYQDEFRDAIDNLYPIGHELVHIDMVDEAIDEAVKKSEGGE